MIKVKNRNGKQDEWIDENLRELMRWRNYYRRKHYKTHNQDDWNRFRALRNEVNHRMRSSKKDYNEAICKDINHQPRATWSHLNSILGQSKSKRISSLRFEGKRITRDEDIVNTFINHFSNLPSSFSTTISYQLLTVSPTNIIKFFLIDEELMLKMFSSLDELKASGPITPVPQSGDKDDVSNYWPVSVIPVLAKIFESLVHRQLYHYLETNSLLNDAQSGFRPNRSTQDVLHRTVDDWKIALDQGEIVGTVMIDLSKAFDIIDHPLLLKKLDAYGVRGSELKWFTDYLSGRKQRVVMDGVLSVWKDIVKGVPQGSILGPLLFTIFVNDLPDTVVP